jgi:hypothetical protein
MQKLRLAAAMSATSLALAFAVSTPVFADAPDPTMHQIYEAAQGGHLDQAQTMIDQVLRDHPKSAKAHYVQAELYAREGKSTLARAELATAEQLEPGLPFAKPQSIQELRAELAAGQRTGTQYGAAPAVRYLPAARTPAFPWGTVLILAIVLGVLWMLFRRRSTGQYPVAGPHVIGGGPGTYGSPGYGGPGSGGPGGPVGGGVGGGMMGGLASGLAVGAGVVAGEELAHHFLDGGRRENTVLPPANDTDDARLANGDMGGSDFGVTDAGSWDDNSGSGGGDFGGGGGDDWS